jgi:hypothetical protein
MDEVADNAAYAAVMRLAHDLNDDDDVSERLAVPLRPTPPPPAPAAAALAPPTTRVVNRHAPSANAAFVGISNRDADTPTVRLGTAAVTLAPRRGENVVRAQMAAVEARGEEETGLVRVREEERRAHFAAAPGAPGVANSRGRSHTKTLPPPALARLVVEQIGGERRVHLDHLAPRSASDGAPSNAASPLYASGVVFHLRASSKLGGGTLLLHKFADQSATIVAGLLAHGAKPQRVHLAFELCSAWRVALEDRAGLANAIGAVKGFGPDAAIVYCALSPRDALVRGGAHRHRRRRRARARPGGVPDGGRPNDRRRSGQADAVPRVRHRDVRRAFDLRAVLVARHRRAAV